MDLDKLLQVAGLTDTFSTLSLIDPQYDNPCQESCSGGCSAGCSGSCKPGNTA